MKLNTDLFKEFRAFCLSGYMNNWDIDPVYPVLKEVHGRRWATKEQAIWHTLLYVTWYHLGSAEYMLQRYPEPCLIKEIPVLPTGIERRGFRGTAGSILINSVLSYFGKMVDQMTLECWMDNCTDWAQFNGIAGSTFDRTMGWRQLYQAFISIRNNGPWAGYKWCDLSKNVLGYNITAPDIGVGGGSATAGPIPGMVQLTGLPWQTCARDIDTQWALYAMCQGEGIPFDGLEEMETALCDFNSYLHGRYYPGHDIDKQQEQFTQMNVPPVYWEARRAVFPAEWLGEVSGWYGVRKHLFNRRSV